MAKDLILKSTSVDDKRPTPSQLEIGEISLGYNEAGAFLCCKDTAGNIQQVGGIKFSEDAPGTPVRGTLWLKPSTFILYGYDGQFWLPIASGGGGGGGSSAVSEIVAGDGIDVTPTPGIGVVTLNIDIDQTKGLEILAGRLTVAIGEGLAYDPNTGKLNATAGGLAYKGEVDVTTSAARPTNPLSGDMYLNNGTGNSNAVWNPDITTNTSVTVGDIIVYNGTTWDLIKTSDVIPNPILWVRSNGVTSTFNTGDDVEIGSGAIELNSSGSAQFTGPVVYQNTSAPGGTTAIQVKDGSSTVFRVYANGETVVPNTAYFGSAGNTKLYANGGVDVAGNLVIGQSSTLTSSGGAEFSNNVLVGGTLPSAPNIELKSNGSTVFKGKTHEFGSIGSTGPQYISINSGGSSTLYGYELRDRPAVFSSTSYSSNTYFGVKTAAAKFSFRIADDWDSIGTEVASITGNGSAVFNGQVQINGTSGSANRLKITQTGSNASDQSNIRLTTPASDYILYSTGSDNRLSIFDSNANANRLQLDGNGNVRIGGTLPSSPNIELNSNGNIKGLGSFHQFGTFDSSSVSASAIGADIRAGTISVKRNDASGNPVLKGYNIDGTLSTSINGDGSATFDGALRADGGFRVINTSGANIKAFQVTQPSTVDNGRFIKLNLNDATSPSQKYAEINATSDGIGTQNLRLRANVTDITGNVQIGGTLPSSPNISLNADGSATFAGFVLSNNAFVSERTAAGNFILLGKLNGTQTSLIEADGSAEFAGSVESGTVNTSSTTASGCLLNSGGILVSQRASASGSGANVLQGWLGNTKTTTITAGGSADFAGSIVAGPINISQNTTTNLGVQLSDGGLVRVQRPSNATTNVPVFSGFNGNSENVTLNSDGSAKFDGSVSIGGTAAANTIDEYEEGTWTPVIEGDGVNTFSGTGTGIYVKCGNQVVGSLNMRYNASSNITDDTKIVRITGFPWTTNSVVQEIPFLIDNRSNNNTSYAAYSTNTLGFRGVMYDGEIRLYNLETGAPITWADVKTPTTGPDTGFKAVFTIIGLD